MSLVADHFACLCVEQAYILKIRGRKREFEIKVGNFRLGHNCLLVNAAIITDCLKSGNV